MPVKNYITLNSGFKMPIVGIGTRQEQYDCNENELINALDKALELGYRHIDAAYSYRNEVIIGTVLKKWLDSGKLKRENLFVTTKLPPIAMHPDHVETFLKKSLDSLQLEYVDLYLIHSPMGLKFKETGTSVIPVNRQGGVEAVETDHIAVWKKMEEQVDAGRAKSIGISNFNVRQIDRILKFCRIKPANLQIEAHLFFQQKELVDFCHKFGISVVAYAPIGSPNYNKVLKSFGREEKVLPNILGDPVVGKIAKKHLKTSAQIALKFLMQREIAVIPKSVTLKRIEENFDVFNFELDDDDMKVLGNLDKGSKARICNPFSELKDHPEYPY